MERKIKNCFLITPIGDEKSEEREKVDALLDKLFIPLLKSEGYDVTVSHRIKKIGSIFDSIIDHILTDELVIADLTNLNPNVMYELAIRHAKNLPAIVIAAKGTKLPFDIKDERTFFYENSIPGGEQLKKDIKDILSDMGKGKEYENPIYRSTTATNIMTSSKSSDFEKSIIARFNRLETIIRNINFQNLIPDTNHVVNVTVKINDQEKGSSLFEGYLSNLPYIESYIKIPSENDGEGCFKYLIPSENAQELLGHIAFELMNFDKRNPNILLLGTGIGYGH